MNELRNSRRIGTLKLSPLWRNQKYLTKTVYFWRGTQGLEYPDEDPNIGSP